MKKEFLIIPLLMLACLFNAKAQVAGGALTKLNPVKVPEAYKMPQGKIALLGAPRIKTNSYPYSSSYWIVFSDRDDNQTYKDANLQQPYSKINFKEIFIVAAETEKAVRLVTYDAANPAVDEQKGKVNFLPSAQDAGWISKKNLLLWSVCEVDSLNGYARKAVAIKQLNNEEDFVNMVKRGVLDFYDAPDLTHENSADVKLFQYLFIFKEENGMYLLGNINVLKANTISYDLYGWAPKKQVREWTSAICLRVNFDPQAIDEREKKQIEPTFFRTEAQATDYKDGKPAKSLLFYYSDPTDNNNKKDNPFLLGYPILSTCKDPSVFRTGYVTDTRNKQGKNIFTALSTAELTKNWETIKNQKEKINLLFVLDGANRNFYKTLIQAIDANASIGNTNVTSNKYQLGALIYNDLQCGEEEAFTKIRFRDKDNFLESLKSEADKVPSCSVNRMSGAPMNDALKMACDLFENDKTTNVIIVVGSVTDNDQTKKEAALKTLINKDVKVVFYQTANKDGRYYDYFISNINYYLKGISDAADASFKASIDKKLRKKADLYCEGEKCELTNSSVLGEGYFKDRGKQFSSQEINSNLKGLLLRLENDLNATKALFDQNIVGTGKDANSHEDEDRIKEFQSWLYDAGITDATIQKLSSMDNYQIFIEGYTALKPKSAINQIFERNLFVAEKEFLKLYDMIEKVTEAFTASNKRVSIVNACREIILTYKGPMDDKQKDQFSMEQVYQMITSLKGQTNNKLFKKSLKSLLSEKETTPDDINKMYDSFHQVYERLKGLRRNTFNKYEQDDQLFYWVPESKLSVDES